jgi:probable FeS assembly SUF system protein SufT
MTCLIKIVIIWARFYIFWVLNIVFSQSTWAISLREVDGLLIPTAIPITIPAGTNLEITQAKGRGITIHVSGQLIRVESKDADALGLNPEDFAELEVEHNKLITGPAELELVWDKLKTCYDPEIPVNVVELGLIYSLDIVNDNDVNIYMTLTAPSCSMGPVLVKDIEHAVMQVNNIASCKVELVFDPPWSKDNMSEAAKLELGIF